ncbi:McrB family protein [Acinetobacter pittii]|uniref:McrB family protein n=1 Tax=Acinetobacter pittii TaxID=48296 RepID=UPI00070C5CE8|nr:AAA family ATPase [Acinetobacter pittii]KRJ14931.1 restriction endonuclease [Acinetobacter pittii]MCU4345507.1 AAA family ATPase [Acinetobacter pittii]MCU4355791.1 AAA family ATPase [Acinetobacter pittii]MRA44561.1 AAA domain-containing protein [Acinetobacter pittii]
MNYWHIQLHPDSRLDVDTLKAILMKKQVIGMGEYWEDKKGNSVIDPKLFKNDMKIDDVVMVRDGSTPVALVKVKGDAYIEHNTDDEFDWFKLRRQIEILGFYEEDEKNLLYQILTAYGKSHIQAPGTLTCCNGSNATNNFIVKWYKLRTYKRLMENIKLSQERQTHIKVLWNKFKNETKEEEKKFNKDEVEKLISEWKLYKHKILNDTLSLDDYTNILGSSTAIMPGGYLCNFLERTTRIVLGSSKPGTAFNFEVKLNDDNSTYHIKSVNKSNATRQDAELYFNEKIKGLLKSIVSKTDPLEKIYLIENSNYSAKQVLMKLAVLDNLSDFLYIYSTQWLEELYNEFIDSDAEEIFRKNYQVCLVAKKLLDVNEQDKNELVLLSRFLWRFVNSKSIADTNNPNVILYGPPGTGKTFSVKSSLDFVCQGDTSRYEVLQFHPSFTYEDFIEGIKPKGVSKDGNIRFELVNGIFKNFCIKAKKHPEKDFYFVVDEINRANLSMVFGETLSLLEKDYRQDTENKNLIRTQYSALIEDLIKEDNKFKDLAYEIHNNEVKFGVPKNVFFIGMMNDVDKSIDAFDLALRRRFKWIRKDCDYEVIEEETRFKGKDQFNNIGLYVKACEKLNDYISKDLGLGKSYEFGHSFFMKISDIAKRKDITNNNIEILFNLYLRPTLKEYLRAVFVESELESRLDEALNKFKETIK